MRVFIDTSVFIAACGSATGGSRALFAIAHNDPSLQLVASDYVLTEAMRNIEKKLPNALNDFILLRHESHLMISREAPNVLLKSVATIIHAKDAPILATALFSRSQYLCTLDKKDFLTPATRKTCAALGIIVGTPGEILEQWNP